MNYMMILLYSSYSYFDTLSKLRFVIQDSLNASIDSKTFTHLSIYFNLIKLLAIAFLKVHSDFIFMANIQFKLFDYINYYRYVNIVKHFTPYLYFHMP